MSSVENLESCFGKWEKKLGFKQRNLVVGFSKQSLCNYRQNEIFHVCLRRERNEKALKISFHNRRPEKSINKKLDFFWGKDRRMHLSNHIPWSNHYRKK